jgi:hypothetical protein
MLGFLQFPRSEDSDELKHVTWVATYGLVTPSRSSYDYHVADLTRRTRNS